MRVDAPSELSLPAATCYGSAVSSPLDGLAAGLQALRKRAGLTQPELSERCGVAVQLLSRYEGGQRMRLDTLEAILRALGADLYDLGVAAAAASGRALPGEARNGGSEFTPDQLKRLDEEAHLTALSLTVRHLRTLRGQIEPDPEDMEP